MVLGRLSTGPTGVLGHGLGHGDPLQAKGDHAFGDFDVSDKAEDNATLARFAATRLVLKRI